MTDRERIVAQYLLLNSGTGKPGKNWEDLAPETQEEYLADARAYILRVDAAEAAGAPVPPRKSLYTRTQERAEELYTADNTYQSWRNVSPAERQEYIERASALIEAEVQAKATEAERRAKMAAVDAYRQSIVSTVPAHRLDTRQNGFMDGWDAALAWVAYQARRESHR